MFIGILEQVLLYLPLMLGIMFSFRILKLTDLTVDGSFVLGAATCARCLIEGYSISFALMAAIVMGALAGLVVGLLQANQRMTSLMAGILALFMLYSVNFQVMGKPNINLLATTTLFKLAAQISISPVLLMLIANIIIVGLLYFLLNTRLGLLFRALGDNPKALEKMGFSVNRFRCFGLMISNGLAGFCGAMVAQINGFADLHMGVGIALVGIGAVVIGNAILMRIKVISTSYNYLLCSVIGAAVYFSLLSFLLKYGIEPIQVKLLMGLILILVLSQKKQPLVR